MMMAGATLFLTAQILLPPGTADATTRISSIHQSIVIWQMGHILILLAVPLLMMGFVRLRELVHLLNPGLAIWGLLFILFGLVSEAAIAGLQVASAGVVETLGDQVALQVLSTGFNTKEVQMGLFMPYLLILPGTILLALPLRKVSGYKQTMAFFLIFGVLAIAGGVFQMKWAFVGAGLCLLIGFGLICFQKTERP